MKIENIFLVCILFFELGVILFYGMPFIFQTPSFVLEIQSDSMSPVLGVGDYVLVDGRREAYLGDIVAFYDPLSGDIIVHRVIEKKGECFVTKGDNSMFEDFFRPCSGYVLGVVK